MLTAALARMGGVASLLLLNTKACILFCSPQDVFENDVIIISQGLIPLISMHI